jgi:hypothetical protein
LVYSGKITLNFWKVCVVVNPPEALGKVFDLYRELRSVGLETFVRCFALFTEQASILNRHELGEQMLLHLKAINAPHKGKSYHREASHAKRVFQAGLEFHALDYCANAPRLGDALKHQAQYLLEHASLLLDPVEDQELTTHQGGMVVLESEMYQQKVSQAPSSLSLAEILLFPVQKPTTKSRMTSAGWMRNTRVARESLQMAQYQCDLNPDHQTFISASSGRPYIEAHHLIPMQVQDMHAFSLDVHSNIVPLCPTCHRRIHFAHPSERHEAVIALWQKRRPLLERQQLIISREKLLSFYG